MLRLKDKEILEIWPIVQHFIFFLKFDHTRFFSTGNGAIHGIVKLVLLNKQHSVVCFILTIKNGPKPHALKTGNNLFPYKLFSDCHHITSLPDILKLAHVRNTPVRRFFPHRRDRTETRRA